MNIYFLTSMKKTLFSKKLGAVHNNNYYTHP